MGAGRCKVAGSLIELGAESLLWLDGASGTLTFEPEDVAAEHPAWWMAAGELETAS